MDGVGSILLSQPPTLIWKQELVCIPLPSLVNKPNRRAGVSRAPTPWNMPSLIKLFKQLIQQKLKIYFSCNWDKVAKFFVQESS